jgi:hypothetical protein
MTAVRDRTKFKAGRSSWMNLCTPEREASDVGDVTFFGFFEPKPIPESEGDIEIVLKGRMRVDQLATIYYGDQGLWWVIAQRNDYGLPLAEGNEGDKVVIPSPAYVKGNLVK